MLASNNSPTMTCFIQVVEIIMYFTRAISPYPHFAVLERIIGAQIISNMRERREWRGLPGHKPGIMRPAAAGKKQESQHRCHHHSHGQNNPPSPHIYTFQFRKQIIQRTRRVTLPVPRDEAKNTPLRQDILRKQLEFAPVTVLRLPLCGVAEV